MTKRDANDMVKAKQKLDPATTGPVEKLDEQPPPLDLQKTEEGRVRSTQHNANQLFQHHEAWHGVLGYDDRAICPCLLSAPRVPGFGGGPFPRPLTDVDVTECIAWASIDTGTEFTESKVRRALELAASRRPFDHVADYLNGLEWDQTPRLEHWLHRYLGAEDTPFQRMVGRMFLISAVARTLRPGCQADHVLVLEGAQGLGKSSAVRILAGEYFVSDPPILGSKDSKEILRNAWMVECSELSSMRKSTLEAAKSYISQTRDTFRSPYARQSKTVPRRAVFTGTTNEATYLKDATGNRRFWPVRCEQLDRAALERDRDQLWAEAVVAYGRREHWYPTTPEQKALAHEAQALRVEVDPWEEDVLMCAQQHPQGVSVTEVMEKLGLTVERRDQRSKNRIVTILKKAGYERVQVRWDGQRRWVYRRDDPPNAPVSPPKSDKT